MLACLSALCISILRFVIWSLVPYLVPPVRLQFPFRSSLGYFRVWSEEGSCLHRRPEQLFYSLHTVVNHFKRYTTVGVSLLPQASTPGSNHALPCSLNRAAADGQQLTSVLFCSLAVLDPRVGHTMDVLSPFISVLWHSNWLFYRESCPRLDVVNPGRAWSSSPACTWHCSLHYLFLQATPFFSHGMTILY